MKLPASPRVEGTEHLASQAPDLVRLLAGLNPVKSLVIVELCE